MPSIHVTVRGHVHGVGFRAFVRDLAEELEVEGEVWNTRAGGVEALASHASEAVLEDFASRLQRGPGRVAEVTAEQTELQVGPGFTVGPTR